jgi:hypothetical protein
VIVSAQLINIKSVPVATGDQFLLYPSENLGMGGVNIAIDDSLLDPFINPAQGRLIRRNMITTTPSSYSISDDLGSAQTLPLSVLSHSENWFGTASLAIQEVTPSINNSEMYANGNGVLGNSYLSASVGRHMGSNLSMGISLSWARLKSVGGVEYLYGDANRIEQNGKLLDLRLGMLANLDETRTLESIVLYNRYDVTHYTGSFSMIEPWMDRREFTNFRSMEENKDRTHTLGLHLGYTQQILGSAWKWGGIFTANRKMHPKIPNYTLMSIRRDPGDSWAFNFGLGLSGSANGTTVGIDFIYEPIWSHTWADAAEPVFVDDSRTIMATEKTVDNYFTFSNWLLRLGIKIQESTTVVDFGIEVNYISYNLNQKDYRIDAQRTQFENWYEYTGSVGISLNYKPFQIRYTGRVTVGTGVPGTSNNVFSNASERGATYMADFLPAPNGDLSLREAIILSHRITLAIPLGT